MPAKPYRRGTITKTLGKKGPRFQAYLTVDGKRHRKWFGDEHSAKNWIDSVDPLSNSDLPPLNAGSMIDAAKALAILPEGVSLQEAAKFFIEHQKSIEEIRIDEAIDKFLEAKKATGLRVTTIRTYRQHLSKLRGLSKFVHQIRTQDLEGTFKKNYGSETINNYRRSYMAFFNWAIKRKYADENPTDPLEPPKKDQTPASIFDNEQTAQLLFVCKELYPELLAEFTLGLFAGIRPHELSRLRWEDVTDEHVKIGGKQAKLRSMRLVEVASSLKAWLALVRPEDGSQRICHGARDTRRLNKKTAREIAGVHDWPNDILRHTYASNHLALHKDAAATATELGHQSTDMLYDHYRSLVTQADAKKFFAIKPKGIEKLVPKKLIGTVERLKTELEEDEAV